METDKKAPHSSNLKARVHTRHPGQGIWVYYLRWKQTKTFGVIYFYLHLRTKY